MGKNFNTFCLILFVYSTYGQLPLVFGAEYDNSSPSDAVKNYLKGKYDYAFPDTYNSVSGNYGGILIMPAPIAENIYYILDRKAEKK